MMLERNGKKDTWADRIRQDGLREVSERLRLSKDFLLWQCWNINCQVPSAIDTGLLVSSVLIY